MIAAPLTLKPLPNRTRRSAFTLLEVLVVVAILVVLASVASIAVFKYLDDAKEDKARMDMQALEKVYKTYAMRQDIQPGQDFDMGQMVMNMENGVGALQDPWSGNYQYRWIQGGNGDQKIQFFTNSPKSGEIVWPKY
jgi:general secretion pathway protein G